MQQLRVEGFTISIDGYGAGPNQSLKDPLGVGGESLHEWLVHTRTFEQMHGGKGGSIGIDEDFAARGFENVGAWIMGRNMFAPSRGPWPDDEWRGWWGKNPPYHTPVYVLTSHPRDSIEMKGGHRLSFPHGRDTGCAGSGLRCCRWKGRSPWRRCGHHSTISTGATNRQDAPGYLSGAARLRRTSAGRYGFAGARVQDKRASCQR
jgi:dihydrofolate reductase